MSQGLFEVLANDQRIIVYSSADNGLIFAWNQEGSLTCWAGTGSAHVSRHMPSGCWEHIGTLEHVERIENYDQARKIAIDWYNQSLSY